MSSARISRSADPHPKILDLHRKKLAVIYVRQSSLYQVENHLESQKRQYQLTERAELLGWPTARCVVIDEDLGISGAQSFNRPGYQRLVSMVALREVGIVFGLEISRLARNSLDWYQLLELAAAFDVLIADEDGVYNPAEFNDRLLLGLKGTISEVELYQIKPEWCAGASIRHNVIRRDCRPVCQVNCHDPRRASATALCHITWPDIGSLSPFVHRLPFFIRLSLSGHDTWQNCQQMGRIFRLSQVYFLWDRLNRH